MMTGHKIRDRRTENRYFVDNVILDEYGEKLGPYGLAVYMALCRFADLDDQDCYPTHETIAKRTGMARTTVLAKLKELRELRLVTWEKRQRSDGGNTSNIYYLLDPPVAHTNRGCSSDEQAPVAQTNTNNPHVEQSLSNNIPKGAQAPDPPPPPSSYCGWMEHVREASNKPAALRWMVKVIYDYYQEDELPTYGYIGKVTKRVGGHMRLAQMIWDTARHQPQGNLMDYIQQIQNNGGPSYEQQDVKKPEKPTPGEQARREWRRKQLAKAQEQWRRESETEGLDS
jgi:hypothetical protein